MKSFKKIICTLLVVVMCLTSAPLQGFMDIEWPNFSKWFCSKVNAVEIIDIGTCGSNGDNIVWTLYNDGTLVISGEGEMADFGDYGDRSPFIDLNFKTIIIEDNITYIGASAFEHCNYVEKIYIGEDVEVISDFAIYDCESLESIYMYIGVDTIGYPGFVGCDKLKDIYYSGTKEQWHRIAVLTFDNVWHNAMVHYNYSIEIPNFNSSTNTDNPDNPANPTVPQYRFMIVSTGNFKDSLVLNENIEFTAVVYKNEVKLLNAENYVVSFDNTDILEVEKVGIEENSSGKDRFKVKLKAKKVGSTNMTISDPSTGAYITVPMKVAKEIETYRMNDIEQLAKEYQKGRKTHFYDYNGLYVDSYRYWYTVSNTYAIRMDVYNEKAHYGAVVAYDRDGYICDYDIIDANPKLPSSLDDVYLETGKIYDDAISKIKDSKSYTHETLTVRTPIDIVVPHDGYFEISNNFLDNEIVFLANIIEIAFNTAVTSAAFLFEDLDGEPAKKIVDKTIKEILEDLGAEGLKAVFKETLKRVTKKITYDNVNDVIKIFSETMKEVDVNFWGILIDVIKTELKVAVLEELFLSIIYGGEQIKKIFQTAGNANYVLHLYDSFASKKSPSINIYPPITIGDIYESRGVKVTSETPLDPEYVLHTYIVEEYDERMEDAKSKIEALSSNYKMYDITLYKSGAAVQPNAKIKVMIPIPTGYNKNNIQVYWYKEDGTLESMNAIVSGSYVIFETDHLSYYVLVEERVHSHADENHDGICDSCGFDHTESCTCRCHKTGFITKLIWKITIFFNKLLRRNQVCHCGIYHY